jgi:septal ring factor EnvC (AmiA/AmiB activator)
LLRRQKDRLEQAKMEKELQEKNLLEEAERQRAAAAAASKDRQGSVAQPGAGNRNKRFGPKKRGRIGL